MRKSRETKGGEDEKEKNTIFELLFIEVVDSTCARTTRKKMEWHQGKHIQSLDSLSPKRNFRNGT